MTTLKDYTFNKLELLLLARIHSIGGLTLHGAITAGKQFDTNLDADTIISYLYNLEDRGFIMKVHVDGDTRDFFRAIPIEIVP